MVRVFVAQILCAGVFIIVQFNPITIIKTEESMASIDTLQAYEDLIASGITEKEAKAQVHLLNNSLNGLATREDLHREINGLEKRIDSKFDTIEKFGGGFLITMTALLLKIAFWS